MSIGPANYPAAYYGVGAAKPLANYAGYSAERMPHWAAPLAEILRTFGGPRLLDIGAAYGHLAQLYGPGAVALEWSPWASARAVCQAMVRADGRRLPFAAAGFNTVVSLDFLEHNPPEDVPVVIGEIARVLSPGGLTVHLLGIPDGDGGGNHYDDPTHQTHEPLAWYQRRFIAAGFRLQPGLTDRLNWEPAWRQSDWNGRWIALRKQRRETPAS